MRRADPVVADTSLSVPTALPGVSVGCRAHLSEIARVEWAAPHAGWAADLEAFLAGHGLPARDLTAAPSTDHRVCGAAVLLSATAGAVLTGSPSRKSPAHGVPDVVAVVYGPGGRATRPPKPGPWRLGGWEPSWSTAEHAAAVGAVRAAIGRGDVYQVNVVGHASAPYLGDPVAALHRLGSVPGARYGGVLRGEGWAVGCASPETLVAVSGGTVRTRPIKGTRPATTRGRTELLASPKERAEHVMIVDLSRNDLARVARVGSVRVEELYGVRRWSNLWQAESTVSARLAGGVGLAELLRAVCPGGSVTGAPKLAALDVVAALEPVGRGPSMGACGWIGPDSIDLGLTIRTVAPRSVGAELVDGRARGGGRGRAGGHRTRRRVPGERRRPRVRPVSG